MNVVVVTGGGEREVVLDLDPDHGTVGDLAAAVAGGEDPGQSPGLLIDGRFVAAATPLIEAGLRQGAVLQPADGPPRPAAAATPLVEVRVVGGLTAAATVGLPAGSHVLGRRGTAVELDSPTVSPSHARLDVAADGTAAVEDLGRIGQALPAPARLGRPQPQEGVTEAADALGQLGQAGGALPLHPAAVGDEVAQGHDRAEQGEGGHGGTDLDAEEDAEAGRGDDREPAEAKAGGRLLEGGRRTQGGRRGPEG